MSDSTLAIEFKNVSKRFTFHHQKTLKELVHAVFGKKKTREEVLALQNVSFSIAKGETVGIIGKNGAGKSTLLKLIAGVSTPTRGNVLASGMVSPLIELGAGFHPELTGRENIYLNGVILGMREYEVDKKFDSIVAFSELHDLIDTPVKYYSSGQYMRLAFSVATARVPDILLIDEILAVGDSEFQEKCMAKMQEYKKAGVTIIFISHDKEAVLGFCERVLYLQDGKLLFDGKTKDGMHKYEDSIHHYV